MGEQHEPGHEPEPDAERRAYARGAGQVLVELEAEDVSRIARRELRLDALDFVSSGLSRSVLATLIPKLCDDDSPDVLVLAPHEALTRLRERRPGECHPYEHEVLGVVEDHFWSTDDGAFAVFWLAAPDGWSRSWAATALACAMQGERYVALLCDVDMVPHVDRIAQFVVIDAPIGERASGVKAFVDECDGGSAADGVALFSPLGDAGAEQLFDALRDSSWEVIEHRLGDAVLKVAAEAADQG